MNMNTSALTLDVRGGRWVGMVCREGFGSVAGVRGGHVPPVSLSLSLAREAMVVAIVRRSSLTGFMVRRCPPQVPEHVLTRPLSTQRASICSSALRSRRNGVDVERRWSCIDARIRYVVG
ncbi:hypothetical protein AB1N83_013165 [Pleurotus pulmonarius]